MLTQRDFENEVTRCAQEGHALCMKSYGAVTRLYLYGKPGHFQLAQDTPSADWDLVTPEESGVYSKTVDGLRVWVLKQARLFPFYAEKTAVS